MTKRLRVKTFALEELQSCQRCPRLRHQFKQLRVRYPDYWNRPVAGAGPETASLLLVGLAPGLHGANRSGIPFEGDSSGDLIHKTLGKLGLSGSVRITNVLKCLPKQNKPSTEELGRCHRFFEAEIDSFCRGGGRAIFALGRVAHERVLKTLGLRLALYPFAHSAVHRLSPELTLVDSYHCSRYNTQTGRLTETMFRLALRQAAKAAGVLTDKGSSAKSSVAMQAAANGLPTSRSGAKKKNKTVKIKPKKS